MFDSKLAASGIAYPSDLTLLKRVYDRVCAEQGLAEGCPEAAKLAASAMQLFARGIFEEETLYRELHRSCRPGSSRNGAASRRS